MSERPEFPGIEEEIPAGLAYKEAYWEAALTGIKAREAFLFRLRLAIGFGIVLLIGLGGSGWYYLTPAEGQYAMTKSGYFMTNHQGYRSTDSIETAYNFDQSSDGTNDSTGSTSDIEVSNEATLSEGGNPELAAVGERATDQITSTPSSSLDAVADNQDDSSEAQSVNSIVDATSDHNDQSRSNDEQPVNEVTMGFDSQTDADVTPEIEGVSNAIADDHPEESQPEQGNVPPKTATAKDLMASFDGAEAKVQMFESFTLMPSIPLANLPSMLPMSNRPAGAIVEIKHHKILPPLKPFNVQVLMGTSLITDFGSRKDDVVFNPMVGVAADFNVNRKFSVNANVHYFSIKGTDRPFSSQSTTLDFVRKTTTTSVATNKLHYVSLPVNAAYRLGHRTQVSAGVGLSILAQSENVVSVTEEVNGQTTLQEEFRQDGYVSGFNGINTYLNVGLNYYISGNTTWGLTYQYGLSDVTRNDFYRNDGMDRNSRLSAYVRFNVF